MISRSGGALPRRTLDEGVRDDGRKILACIRSAQKFAEIWLLLRIGDEAKYLDYSGQSLALRRVREPAQRHGDICEVIRSKGGPEERYSLGR